MISTLPHIVENAANMFPEREAFRCGKASISFTELDVKTNQLSAYLRKKGLKKGDRVGIYMDRCLETTLAVYGIMKAGGVYVPLDPLAPHPRTLFLLEDCGIEFLVTTPKQFKRVSALLAANKTLANIVGISKEIGVDAIGWEAISEISLESYSPVEILETDLAYIMYTSGSTGAPKGIMHTHLSGLTYAKSAAEVYEVTKEDRIAGHAPLHFDISTFNYFTSPLVGAANVIIPDAYTKLPASLSTLIEQEKISIWYSVPLALVQLLTQGVLEKRDLSSLRWVLFGGENFAPKYLRELMNKWPQATFCNVYGPAEINQCTYYHVPSLPENDMQIPLGKIWKSAIHKILDEQDLEVPKGEAGELVVATPTMMQGYWNNAALTMKSIFIAKNAKEIDQKYYRTGDIVRENENGELIFLGRNDRQVKLRGYRVELDEIEAVLTRHEGVEEAAAVINKVDENVTGIYAAVILHANQVFESDDLVAFCKSHLPSYAVPHQIEIRSNFPRTSSGKIKRSAITTI